MSEKLTIALFGCVNSGKSSIVNALLGKEVARTSARAGETIDRSGFHLKGDYWVTDSELSLNIIDTPGIAEAKDTKHAPIAFDSALKSDLILFIISSDMTEVEKRSLVELYEADKPIVLILNQIDRYTRNQLGEIRLSIYNKIKDLIDQENYIEVSAAPLKKIIVVNNDGKERLVERKGLPDIEKLKSKIIDIANQEGKALKRLNDFTSQFIAKHKVHENELSNLKTKATSKIEDFSVITGAAVGLNPIPLVDLAGGVASIGIMINQLAELYSIKLTESEVEELAIDLWNEGKELLAGVIAANVFGSVIKSIPFLGTIAGCAIQGGSVGYFVYILGLTATEYFANGKTWAHNRSMRTALEDVISHTDRGAITAKITHRMKARMGI